LELMVVLAVLAVLAAVSWPALRRPLQKSRVQDGAQQLGKTFARLRLSAMEEGRTYHFRFQVGSATFQSFPAELLWTDLRDQLSSTGSLGPESVPWSEDLTQSTSDPTANQLGALDDPNAELASTPSLIEERLPEGVRFLEPERGPTPSSAPGPESDGDRAGPDLPLLAVGDVDAHHASWSTPILFYPDGRATGAQLTLVADDNYKLDISVRGLTGAVHIGRPTRIEPATWDNEPQLGQDEPPADLAPATP
jgi:type II secretory pathway pseudopilin PulG